MATNIGNGSITIDGLSEFEAKLKQLQTDSPGFEKRLRGSIRKVLAEARKNLSEDAAAGLQMRSDPRHAYKAVRYAVYKKIFGGQVNILNSRKAGAPTSFEPPRTLTPGQRGGNRRKRESRNLDKYEGADRGFILRWLNEGMTRTNPRVVRFTPNENRKVDKWNKHPNTGNRDAISPRNWFGARSTQELNHVAEKLQVIIDKVINDEFK